MFSLLCGKVCKASPVSMLKSTKIFLKSFFHHFFLIRKLKKTEHSFDFSYSIWFQVFIPNDQRRVVICAVDDPAKQGLPSHNFVSHKCVPFTVVTCKDTVITACTQQILITHTDVIDSVDIVHSNGAIGLTSLPGLVYQARPSLTLQKSERGSSRCYQYA